MLIREVPKTLFTEYNDPAVVQTTGNRQHSVLYGKPGNRVVFEEASEWCRFAVYETIRGGKDDGKLELLFEVAYRMESNALRVLFQLSVLESPTFSAMFLRCESLQRECEDYTPRNTPPSGT